MKPDRDPLAHAVELFPAPEESFERLLRQHQRSQRNRRLVAGAVAAAIIAAVALSAASVLRDRTAAPADPSPTPTPTPTLALALPAMTEAGPHEVAVIGLNGEVREVIPGLPSDVFAPSLSPDGSRLAFVTGGPSGPQIATIGIDGEGFTILGGADATNSPVWSPDGRQIAFVGWNATVEGADQGGDRDIYVMDANGSNVRRLTTGPSDDETPEWSPDGSILAFARNPTTDEFSDQLEIWTVAADGGAATRLTNNHVWEAEPTWSPDGSQIAYFSFGDDHIWVMNADGSDQHPLVTTSNGFFAPQWSPDGSTIVGLGRQRSDGALRVLLLDIATGEVSRLDNLGVKSDWNRVRWMPSGDALLVNHLSD